MDRSKAEQAIRTSLMKTYGAHLPMGATIVCGRTIDKLGGEQLEYTKFWRSDTNQILALATPFVLEELANALQWVAELTEAEPTEPMEILVENGTVHIGGLSDAKR